MPNHVTSVIHCDAKTTKELITLNERGDETFDFNTLIPTPEKIYQGGLGTKEREIYGSDNWYDWNSSNWGTKWNAYDFTRIDEETFSFDTAWAHPEPVIAAMSTKYPDVEFKVAYADEDLGFNLGVYVIKNGEITQEFEPVSNTWLAYEFASRVKYNEDYIAKLEGYQFETIERMADENEDSKYFADMAKELEEYKTEIGQYLSQREAFFTLYEDFDLNDPFSYLNIGDEYVA